MQRVTTSVKPPPTIVGLLEKSDYIGSDSTEYVEGFPEHPRGEYTHYWALEDAQIALVVYRSNIQAGGTGLVCYKPYDTLLLVSLRTEQVEFVDTCFREGSSIVLERLELKDREIVVKYRIHKRFEHNKECRCPLAEGGHIGEPVVKLLGTVKLA